MEELRLNAYPLAYLITFTSYGSRLHGNAAGSVDRDHIHPGTPNLAPNRERLRSARGRMVQPAYKMDPPRRDLVLKTILEVCNYRSWTALAVHVRTNHVHCVVQAQNS